MLASISASVMRFVPSGSETVSLHSSFEILAMSHRFEHRAVRGAPFVEGRTLVGVLLLVADDENGRGRGLLRVVRKFLDAPQLLRLLDDHHLVLSHHGHLPAEVHHLSGVGVAAIDGDLVEGPRRLVEDGRGEPFGQRVDEVALLAHEQVNGSEPPGRDLCGELFVPGDRVAEFECAFCHVFRESLW